MAAQRTGPRRATDYMDVQQAQPPTPAPARPPVVDSTAPGVWPLAGVLENIRSRFRVVRTPMDVEHEIRNLRNTVDTLAAHTIPAIIELQARLDAQERNAK